MSCDKEMNTYLVRNRSVEYKTKLILTPTFFASWRTPARLMKDAGKHWKTKRAKDIDLEDDERDDLFITSGGPNFEPNWKATKITDALEEVMSRIIKPPTSHRDPKRDEKQMAAFLKDNENAGFPDQLQAQDWMPGGAPAVCYAAHNRIKALPDLYGGWQYPPLPVIDDINLKAGISYSSFENTHVMEFTLNKDLNMDQLLTFVRGNAEADEAHMPGIPMAFDIEEFKVSHDALQYLKNWKNLPAEEKFKAQSFPSPSYYDKGKNIVSRILLGNGTTWMCTLRFPWGPERLSKSAGTQQVFRPDPTYVKEALESIFKNRTVFGAGVIMDVTELGKFIWDVYGIQVDLPNAVETCALALTAGYRFPTTKLWFLQLLITGGVHNKQVSCADNQWGLPWDQLPLEFQLYALADVKHSYMCYTVLMTLCINHMFPDPVPVCEFFSLPQDRCFEYLSKLILAALINKRFDHSAFKDARTRADLVCSLRTVNQSSKAGAPEELKWLGRIIPPWPTLPYGGARDFQTVAIYFAHGQADKLLALRASLSQRRSDGIMIFTREHKITPEEINVITYGREPQIPTTYLATRCPNPLPCRQDLANSGYEVTGHKTADLAGQKKTTGVALIPGTLEWFRKRSVDQSLQYMYQLAALGSRIADDEYKEVWTNKPMIYQKLKGQLAARTNKLIEPSQHMERVIAGKVPVVLAQEEKRENKMLDMIAYHESRKEKIKASLLSGKLPASKVDIQGQHYKHHPSTRNHLTAKRKMRRVKFAEKNKTSINSRKKRASKPATRGGVINQVPDARSIIQAKQTAQPLQPNIGGEGLAQRVHFAPSPESYRDRSPLPSTSRAYEPVSTRTPSPERAELGLEKAKTTAPEGAAGGQGKFLKLVSQATYIPDQTYRPRSPPGADMMKISLQRTTNDRTITYEHAWTSTTSIPEEWIDPIPEPHPSGYSDISSDEMDFRPLGRFGKKK